MTRKAMKMALEALEGGHLDRAYGYIQEALAQLEPWTPEDMAYRPGGLAHPKQMARLGWQYVECPACGSEGARAFPKPEQEPVAWIDDDGNLQRDEPPYSYGPDPRPLYLVPPQRQPLTDAEIWQMVNDCVIGGDLHAIKYGRAIEAAHNIGDKAWTQNQ